MMQTKRPLFDDVAGGAVATASIARQAARESRASARSGLDRVLSRLDLVRREDFDAVAEIADRALERVTELEARVAELERRRS
jgi:BMFP domain-containing protein YqiC